MKVTILIAVYNTELYLAKCLDSLLSQTHSDWEAICIDDCSTDSSLLILNEYASRDPRIKVIHLNENQGQAKARNIGIEYGTGDLYCFLDSDDWFDAESIEKCVRVFCNNDNADCVLFRLVKVYPDDSEVEYNMNEHFPLDGKTAFERSIDWSIHGVYMTRSDIQKRIPYDDTCRSYSDDNTTRLHYLQSRKVFLSEGTYYYRQNPASVSHINDISRFNFLIANEHMHMLLTEMHADERILSLHENVRLNNLIGCYIFYCNNRSLWSAADRQYAIGEMKRIWHTIRKDRIACQTRRIGYKMCSSWIMFRVEQEIFNALRVLRK